MVCEWAPILGASGDLHRLLFRFGDPRAPGVLPILLLRLLEDDWEEERAEAMKETK